MPYKLILPTGKTRKVPRVTEILRAGMPKPAVYDWELRGVATWAAAHPEVVEQEGPDVAISGFRAGNTAAARGRAVHGWIAAYLKHENLPPLFPDEMGYTDAFKRWFDAHFDGRRPHDMRVEQTLTDSDITVAGTADCIVGRQLYDWKTVGSREDREAHIWPDHLAQLGAYASMTRPVVTGQVGRVSWPDIEVASIVRLYSDGSHRTHTITGPELDDAIRLWRAVRQVAAATMQTSRGAS